MCNFSACSNVYKSERSSYFPVDLEKYTAAISSSSADYFGLNSPQDALKVNTEAGWFPIDQSPGMWLAFRVFTVRN